MLVKLVNIQSFEEAVYNFPDKGLVQIMGENSNGKSILEKVLKSIATCGFFDQEERDSLIRDGKDSGYVIMEYKGKMLSVMLDRQRNGCRVCLVRQDKTRIERTIRDGGIDRLVDEFGFRVYGKKAVVLQFHETFGIMPFVNTSKSLNFEIVDAVTTDTVAQQFVTNFKEITYKRAKDLNGQYNERIQGLKSVLEHMTVYDYEAYEKLTARMQECYAVLQHLLPIKLERIVAPPQVSYINVPEIQLEKLKHVEFCPVMEELENLAPVLKRICDFEEGVCPACGRRYVGVGDCPCG